jgi:hypothetical protein
MKNFLKMPYSISTHFVKYQSILLALWVRSEGYYRLEESLSLSHSRRERGLDLK